MDIVKENVKASQFVGHKNLVEVVEGDIIVPDIKPDILSLVKTNCKAFINSKELLNDKIRIKGTVDTYAMYIADNDTNSFNGMFASIPFEEIIDINGCDSSTIPIIKYNLENVECKALNGRKISIKCTIKIDLKVVKEIELELPKDISEPGNIQVLKEKKELDSLIGCNVENVSINEKINIPDENNSIGEIINCSVDIINSDYKISYNKILAKADARIRIVYIADNEERSIETFEKLIPFTSFVDLEGINDNACIKLFYNLQNFYIRPIYQDMKANAISVDANIEIMALAHEKREIDVIHDLYNPIEVLNYNVNSTVFNQLSSINNNEIIIDQVLSIPELINSKILDVNVIANISDIKTLDDRIVVDGMVDADILFYSISKKMVETKKIELPFQETIDLSGNCEKNDIYIDVLSVDYELNQSGQLRLIIRLNIENNLCNKINLNVIENLEQTKEKMNSIASVIIYPVKPGDSLWEIAKKYRTTIESIKENNGLIDDIIYPGQQLIIPKRVYKVVLNPLD